MDQNILDKINAGAMKRAEHQHVPTKRKVRKPKFMSHKATASSRSKVYARLPKKPASAKTSSIRLSQSAIDRLHALQTVTGDRSRTALIDRILPIVRPVLLNSKAKERKFKRNLKLIKKQRKFMAEMKQKM